MSKSSQKKILIDEAEFIRTRDAVITSWLRLQAALQHASQVYIEHSNTILGGEKAVDHTYLNVLRNAVASAGHYPELDIKHEGDGAEGSGRKPKKIPRDPNAPKRPCTAYLLYANEIRIALNEELGPGHGKEIGYETGRRWNELNNDNKKIYKDRYKSNWAEFVELDKAYRASNNLSPKKYRSLEDLPDGPAAEVDEDDDEVAEPITSTPKSPTKSKSTGKGKNTDKTSGSNSDVSSSEADPTESEDEAAKKGSQSKSSKSKKGLAQKNLEASASSLAGKKSKSNNVSESAGFLAVNDSANKKRKSSPAAQPEDDNINVDVEPVSKKSKKNAFSSGTGNGNGEDDNNNAESAGKKDKESRRRKRKSQGVDASEE